MFLMAVLVLVALIFSFQQWLNSLKLPFLAPIVSQNQETLLGNADNLDRYINLQVKDTDLDGLSDYDELYLYQTSPYLEDSDSDGDSDAQEIQNGDNPKCPKGADCAPASGLASDQAEAGSYTLDNLASLSVEQLRSLLIQRGLPADQVNALDEQTLRQTFLEAAQASQTGNNFSNLITGTDIDLSGEQIRQMLLAQGVEQEELDKLTDEDLVAIWQETVKQFQESLNSGNQNQ